MSPEQSQYIWRKTIPHIEVGMGSGVISCLALWPRGNGASESAFPTKEFDIEEVLLV